MARIFSVFVAGWLMAASALSAQAATYTVREVEVRAQPALVIRSAVPPSEVAQTLGSSIPKVLKFVEARGGSLAGPPITRYLSQSSELFEIEVGFPLTSPLAGEGEIVAIELPGGKAALTNHFGSYQRLGEGHRAIIEWVMANQKSIAGPPWEVYLSDPSSTPEEELVTRIFYPIAGN